MQCFFVIKVDAICLLQVSEKSNTHIQCLLEVLRSSLEVFRLIQFLLQLVQELVLLLQVREKLTPACPHLLQIQRKRQRKCCSMPFNFTTNFLSLSVHSDCPTHSCFD